MNVLAFDTCLSAISVAVRRDCSPGRRYLEEAYAECSSGHAERIIPMIDEAMRQADLTFSDLDRIAVTVGPGTFTGVRTSVATARALALAAQKPVVGVTSLVAMAHEAIARLKLTSGSCAVVVAVDAGRGMVYLQRFSNAAVELTEPLLLSAENCPPLLGSEPSVVVGSGAEAVAAAGAATGTQMDVRLPALQPHAGTIAMIASDLLPASAVRPLYLRAPDARSQAEKSLVRAVS